MPVNLFEKLPQIWKRLDITITDVLEGKGFLERYLIAPDMKFNSFEDLIREFLRCQNIEFLRDAFIPLLNDITGHRWKDSKSRVWNRNRIQASITRASYKGRWQAIYDLARECGSDFCKIIDMASLVGVYDRQASMTQFSHYFDSDYFHPGVFQIWVSDAIDLAEFLEDFEYLKPAGTKWILRILVGECKVSIDLLDFGYPIENCGATYDYTYKIFNRNFGFYDHIPQVAWEPIFNPTVWSYIGNPFPLVYGMSLYNYEPQYPLDPICYEVIWQSLDIGENVSYGTSVYDYIPQLPVNLTLFYATDYLAVANSYLDSGSMTFNWEEYQLLFPDSLIPENLNWKQPIVDPIILT